MGAARELLTASTFPEYASRKTRVRPAGVWSSGNFMITSTGLTAVSAKSIAVARAPGTAACAQRQ